MTSVDCITDVFCRVDEHMLDVPKHPQANLYPSELVPLALRFALKGVGPRAFPRWLTRDYRPLVPHLPHRTRLFRLFATHRAWADYCLAQPTVLGVADSYGIVVLHPIREGRSARHIGRNGTSNHRWIVGGNLAYVVNQMGVIVAWDGSPANLHDTAVHALSADFQHAMVVVTDTGLHAKAGDPPNLKPCKRGTWHGRMVIETVVSMLTTVATSSTTATARGHSFWRAWRSRWRCSMCWSSGMACCQTTRG